MILLLMIICTRCLVSAESLWIPEWESLYSKDFFLNNREYLENAWKWAPENGSIEWSEAEPLLHHLLELDSRDAWSNHLNNSERLNSMRGVFGASPLTKIKQTKDRKCLAQLYDSSKRLSEDEVCTDENYLIMENFVSCWTSWIRTTVIGQYLIWRMLKMVAHCYGLNGDIDVERLTKLRNGIQANDANDCRVMSMFIAWNHSPDVKKAFNIMFDRQVNNAEIIMTKIDVIDKEIRLAQSKRLHNRFKNLFDQQKS